MMLGKTSLEFKEFFTFCENNTRQGTHMRLKLPKYSLQFSRHKLTFRGVVFFNILPPEYMDLTPSLFKRAAKLHILENKQKYQNLMRDINVVGKLHDEDQTVTTPTNISYLELNRKLKAIKRLHQTRTGGPQAWGTNQPKGPIGTTKFWIPTSKDSHKGINQQIGKGIAQDQTYECSSSMFDGPHQKFLRLLPCYEGNQPEKLKIPRALKRLM